jgi:RNA polymerase-binding protein DksA
MRDEVVQRLAQEMRRRREQMAAELAASEAELEEIVEETPIELVDRAEEVRETQLIERLDDRWRRQIEQIDRALGRIAAGTYGKCERCGDAISDERLAALPETPFCLTCAVARSAAAPDA